MKHQCQMNSQKGQESGLQFSFVFYWQQSFITILVFLKKTNIGEAEAVQGTSKKNNVFVFSECLWSEHLLYNYYHIVFVFYVGHLNIWSYFSCFHLSLYYFSCPFLSCLLKQFSCFLQYLGWTSFQLVLLQSVDYFVCFSLSFREGFFFFFFLLKSVQHLHFFCQL